VCWLLPQPGGTNARIFGGPHALGLLARRTAPMLAHTRPRTPGTPRQEAYDPA